MSAPKGEVGPAQETRIKLVMMITSFFIKLSSSLGKLSLALSSMVQNLKNLPDFGAFMRGIEGIKSYLARNFSPFLPEVVGTKEGDYF